MRGPFTRAATLLALCAFPATGVRPQAAVADDKDPGKPIVLAFVGPLSGPLAASAAESLAGLRHAVADREARGGARVRPVKLETFDDGDRPEKAELAYALAVKAKAEAIVAAPTGRTVEAFTTRAGKGKVPTILVGCAAPRATLDPASPVTFLGGWESDHALAIAIALVTPCDARRPGVVLEDSPRGAAAADAIRRNLGPRQEIAGLVSVAAGARPQVARLSELRDARCDRLVLIGEPDLYDATVSALAEMSWDVGLVAGEGMLSRASTSAFDGTPRDALFVVGAPTLTVDLPPRALDDRHAAAGKDAGPLVQRETAAFTATSWTLRAIDGAGHGGRAGKPAQVLAAVRALRYGPEESETPFLDPCGRASLYRYRLWRSTKEGPKALASNEAPNDAFGPLLGMRSPASYDALPGTQVVWLTFGDAQSNAPRTIDVDLAELHLGSRGYEADLDGRIRDELLARTIGKLNRLFLKGEDGSFVPEVSFRISFTAQKPTHLKPSQYWTAVIAGDDAEAGGRAWPGEGRCEIYSTFLRRTIFQPHALEPRVTNEDRAFLLGTYAKGLERMQHVRADTIRALIDGYAGSFALTGAHEIGHLAGLDHDVSDPRSIMNVAEGAGLRESQAWFVPSHATILERLLGRVAPIKDR